MLARNKWIAIGIVVANAWVAEAVAQDEITAGDVRYVLDGQYGLTSEGYAEYRKCIAGIEIGGAMKAYKAALEECKSAAKAKAFPISPSKTPVEPMVGIIIDEKNPVMSGGVETSVRQDRAWQKEVYTK
jgi:hypothetical protein